MAWDSLTNEERNHQAKYEQPSDMGMVDKAEAWDAAVATPRKVQERIRALEATVHRLIAAGDQFAAFDGTQTTETGELWATTRAKFETAKTEAMGTVFATVK